MRVKYLHMGKTVLTVLLISVCSMYIPVSEASEQQTAVPAADINIAEEGRYLSMIGGCNDCHTPGYLLSEGNVPEKLWLTGDTFGWRGPWGTTYGANLRLFVSDLTEDQWVSVAQSLRTRPPMPWFTLNKMKEHDLRALYRFIRSLGPGGGPAPEYVPPDREPDPPYALFPPPPK